MITEPPKINLASQQEPLQKTKSFTRARPSPRRLLLYSVSLLCVVVLTFGYQILFAEHIVFPFANLPFFRALRSLVRSSDIVLRGEQENRINILFLGMGGAGHEGPYLTDTIILGSIEPSTRRIVLTSIPRDLSVPLDMYGWRKVNTVNAFGEVQNPGHGAAFVAQTLATLLRIPIHYSVRVDFDGFQKLIDDLGGVTIDIERSFIDRKYPTTNFKVQTIQFDAGTQLLNGERALQFVRSRHGNNREGSDFARARRQQRIMTAVKRRIFSLWTLTSPTVLSSLVNTFERHVSTDMNLGEMVRFARLLQGIDATAIETVVLDTGPNGLLKETWFSGAFLLEPRGGSFDEIRTYLATLFDADKTSEETVAPEEPVSVDVRNGTRVNGLARTTADQLTRAGFRVVAVANAPEQGYRETVIIDRTDGRKQGAVDQLKTLFGPSTTILRVPSNPGAVSTLAPTILETTADFIIILGIDQIEKNAL